MSEPKARLQGVETAIQATLGKGILDGVFPGGVVAWRSGTETEICARGGFSWPEADAAIPPVTADTVYDLASLTKIVATLPLAMLAVQSGRIGLDDRADRFLPELKTGTGRAWNHAITVRRLLSHTSGLPAWRPYFVRLRGKEEYLSAIADEAPSYPAGTSVEYSDLGFMLLGWILERAWDDSLSSLARRLVFTPLDMDSTGYSPESAPCFKGAAIAPTERGNGFERGMALAYAERKPVIGGFSASYPLEVHDVERLAWRTGIIQGEAHDANCHYGLGGVSGHAGLFSRADDLVRYLRFWDQGSALSPELRSEAFGRQTPEDAVARGLGWLLDKDGVATHTGFTGTSLRYDPATGTSIIALTNRVHPTVRDGIGPWRMELTAALSRYGAVSR